MKQSAEENSKEKILNAAIKLFAQKGFDGTSIREICKEASVNVCMISYYWGGKKELYRGIIDNLIEKQIQYANTFIDINTDPLQLTRQEQIDLLLKILDKFVDFFYSNFSRDLLILLLKEQQKPDCRIDTPVFRYLRKLIASIFNKDESDREIIFKTVFIISQINSPRIMPAFTLGHLEQKEFCDEDIKIIKNNIKSYINFIVNN